MNLKGAYNRLARLDKDSTEILNILDAIRGNKVLSEVTKLEVVNKVYESYDKVVDEKERLENVLEQATKGINIKKTDNEYVVEVK